MPNSRRTWLNSLGAEWLTFSTLPSARKKRAPLPKTGGNSPLDTLIHEVHSRTKLYGGVTIHSLLNWFLENNYSAQQFFENLHAGLASNRLRSEKGVLLSVEK